MYVYAQAKIFRREQNMSCHMEWLQLCNVDGTWNTVLVRSTSVWIWHGTCMCEYRKLETDSTYSIPWNFLYHHFRYSQGTCACLQWRFYCIYTTLKSGHFPTVDNWRTQYEQPTIAVFFTVIHCWPSLDGTTSPWIVTLSWGYQVEQWNKLIRSIYVVKRKWRYSECNTANREEHRHRLSTMFTVNYPLLFPTKSWWRVSCSHDPGLSECFLNTHGLINVCLWS